MLIPIFLHDIFGIRFYKKEKVLDIKNFLPKMKSKIKIDYLGGLLIFFGLLFLAISFLTKNGELEMPKLWQWIISSVLGVITIVLILKVFKVKPLKIPRISLPNKKFSSKKFKLTWSWLWLPAIALALWFGYKEYQKYQTKKQFMNTWSKPAPQTSSNVQAERYFDMNGENLINVGEKVFFKQEDESPILKFAPKSDTVIYTTTKCENKTRTWKIKAWRDSLGKPHWKSLDLEPYDHAKVGLSYLEVDKQVVLTKE